MNVDAEAGLRAAAAASTASYRALRMERFAPSFRAAVELATLPLRAPGHGEITVRHRWCGVNGIFDTQIARNAIPMAKVTLPSLTGVEALGIVEAVGDGVVDLQPGDAVATLRFPGGYRDAATAPASAFAKLPSAARENLVLASTGVSALLALEEGGNVREGETVAVSAAAGGLGHLIVQLAKLRGCTVIAVCGGERKAAFVKSLGADRVIDHHRENVIEVLRREWPDAIDLAIDSVSGTIFDAFVDNLAPRGRLVAAGAAQDLDGRPEIVTGPRIVHQLYYKAASVRAFMNGMCADAWPDARRRLFALHAAGRIHPHVDERAFRGLPAVCDAVEHLLSGRSMGKVLVELDAASA